MQSNWSAEQILSAWGMRQLGPLRTPYKKATGGLSGSDDEEQAMRLVERFAGIQKARPVLVHVYVRGRDAETFQIRYPGETLMKSLLRLGWGGEIGTNEREIARRIHDEFFNALTESLRERPFSPVRMEYEADAMEIAEEMNVAA